MPFDLLSEVEESLASQPVGIIEFAESPDYCNKPLYPRQRVLLKIIFLEELEPWEDEVLDHWIAGGRGGGEIEICPDIRERMEYLRENGYKHFSEIVFAGGRRSSKGYITGIALAYILWHTLQLQDPGTHYGIDPKKEIYFSCVAGSEGQAKEFQFSDFVNTVEGAENFRKYVDDILETEARIFTPADINRRSLEKRQGIRKSRVGARIRGKALAANAGTLRGSATMAMCIDEMAHMLEGESKASAAQVYDAAEPAMDQFGVDAILFCNSSPYSKVGRFYERYQEGLLPFDPAYPANEPIDPTDPDSVNGNPTVLTFRFPSWALFEGYQGYVTTTGHTFDGVIQASPDWDPEERDAEGNHIWSKIDRQRILRARARERSNPEKYKVERRGQFAEVVDAYLNSAMVDRIFMGRPTGFDENGEMILKPYSESIHSAVNLHKYKFHLDPSSTTAGFGFAIAHVETVTEAYLDANGNTQTRDIDHVIFDLIKRWDPQRFPGRTIKWQVVIDEVVQYAEIYRPYEITMDQYQSADPVQSLRIKLMERGISNTYVDQRQPTNRDQWYQWETFKTAINHSLVHASRDTLHMDPYGPDQELKFLQLKATSGNFQRVDKQDAGPVQTKDMADCMAECVNALIGNVIAQQIRDRAIQATMALGSQGGYPIGGNERPSLADLHPNLSGYYPSRRTGEQTLPGGALADMIPSHGRLGRGGGALRGMNRSRNRSRGR